MRRWLMIGIATVVATSGLALRAASAEAPARTGRILFVQPLSGGAVSHPAPDSPGENRFVEEKNEN